MQLKFLRATRIVRGSKYLVEHENKRILIDCGLFQGYKELRLRNWKRLPVGLSSIDAVILTHAYIDHSNYILLLVKNGFNKKVFIAHGKPDVVASLKEKIAERFSWNVEIPKYMQVEVL